MKNFWHFQRCGWASWMIAATSFLLVAPHTTQAATEVTNAAALRGDLGLDALKTDGHALKSLKVAILDNGFAGFGAGKGQLPESATLIPGPGNPQAPTSHGLGMAQIVWAMTGKAAEGPRFYLINANGFTNFKAAVDFVVRERMDIVLYSQVWPFGGNFDGRGFINQAVTRATDAGILWINAAGNFGGMVHESKIARNAGITDEFMRFGERDHLVLENRVDENEIALTLSWSDFQDDESYNTPKDLDLFVYDSQEKLVASAELIQRGEAPPQSGESRLSSHARETLKLRGLDRGQYRIRVVARSANFAANDRLRVLVEAEKPGSVELPARTPGAEIFPPADHPATLTVGEDFRISSRGPTADGRAKPDTMLASSIVEFSNGATVRGSSTAAALLAGVACALHANRPGIKARDILAYARGLRAQAGAAGGADPTAGLIPASPTAWPPLPSGITELVPEGGRLMIHPNGHFVVLVVGDPAGLPALRERGARRLRPGDGLALHRETGQWASIPLAFADDILAPWVEFRDTTPSPTLWRTPTPSELAAW